MSIQLSGSVSARDMQPQPGAVTVIYDGQCPFCSSYVDIVNLRQEFGNVVLVDARDSETWRQWVKGLGFDLNDGFVVVNNNGLVMHGSEALAFLAKADDRRSVFGKTNAALFSDNRHARLAYPFLKFGRAVTLFVLGRKRID